MRGSAMSGAPICIGIIQFARPTVAGITAPNTMTSACMVVIWLKKAGFSSCRPGWNSSARIANANVPPIRNISSENTRYIVPMSLWFVVVSQRMMPFGGPCAWSSWWPACAISFTPWRRAPWRRRFLLAQPGVEFGLGLRDDDDRHEAVVGAAQFRALAAVGAGLVRVHRDPHLVDVAGDRVALHAEVRHPPGVDDVVRGQQHAHLDPGRDHERLVDFEQVVLDAPSDRCRNLSAAPRRSSARAGCRTTRPCRGTRTASTTGGR